MSSQAPRIGRIVSLTIGGEPLPKMRARTTRNGSYTPKRIRENAENVAWEVRIACGHRPFVGVVEVELHFYRRRTDGDLDNLIKQVLDAGNGVAWRDDLQVRRIVADVEYGSTNPRVEIVISERRPMYV